MTIRVAEGAAVHRRLVQAPGDLRTGLPREGAQPVDVLPAWGWGLPVGGGTYHALFPRAWQTFEPEVLGVRLVGEQLSPVIGGDLERSALPVGVFEWWVENPGPESVTVGILATWADPPGGPDHGPAPGRPHEVQRHGDRMLGIRFGEPPSDAPTALQGTLALASRADDGWDLSARAAFDPVADTELWSDFASDGRLEAASPARADSPTAGPAGAAVAATTVLGPGERRAVPGRPEPEWYRRRHPGDQRDERVPGDELPRPAVRDGRDGPSLWVPLGRGECPPG